MTTITDSDIELLCLYAAGKDGQDPCADPATLGMIGERLLYPKKSVTKEHLKRRLAVYPRMTVFLYGYTPAAEKPWEVELEAGRSVTVLNGGAFQRLVDDEGFKHRSAGWERTS